MKTFTEPLKELKEFNDIRDNIKLNTLPVQITGCIDSQKSHLMHSLGEGFLFKVIVTYNDLKAKEIYEDYRLYDKMYSFIHLRILSFTVQIFMVERLLEIGLRSCVDYRKAKYHHCNEPEGGMDSCFPTAYQRSSNYN